VSMESIAAEYARNATIAKNYILHAKTDWERSQNEVKLKAFKDNLDYVKDMVISDTLREAITIVLNYLQYEKNDSQQKTLMNQANAVVKKL